LLGQSASGQKPEFNASKVLAVDLLLTQDLTMRMLSHVPMHQLPVLARKRFAHIFDSMRPSTQARLVDDARVN
jgi:hypothetical protein